MKNDGNVGSVEQLDWVRTILATISGGFDGEIDTETLKVYDYRENKDCCQKVHQIWQILAVKSFAKGSDLVLTSG